MSFNLKKRGRKPQKIKYRSFDGMCVQGWKVHKKTKDGIYIIKENEK